MFSDLGRYEIRSALHHTNVPVLGKSSRQAKVNKFDVEGLQVLTDDVLRLDVQVNHTEGVDVL